MDIVRIPLTAIGKKLLFILSSTVSTRYATAPREPTQILDRAHPIQEARPRDDIEQDGHDQVGPVLLGHRDGNALNERREENENGHSHSDVVSYHQARVALVQLEHTDHHDAIHPDTQEGVGDVDTCGWHVSGKEHRHSDPRHGTQAGDHVVGQTAGDGTEFRDTLDGPQLVQDLAVSDAHYCPLLHCVYRQQREREHRQNGESSK